MYIVHVAKCRSISSNVTRCVQSIETGVYKHLRGGGKDKRFNRGCLLGLPAS